MSDPIDIGRDIAAGMTAIQKAITAGRKEAVREAGAIARDEHLKYADEAPGADRKFSGTNKVNRGRLGVKIRYDYDVGEVRVSPAGPWGLPAGRNRTKPGIRSWDKGEAGTTTKADRTVPAIIDRHVTGAFNRG